jgi:protein-S-isoprenylcysteine O-methyltransferase Ste14
MKTLPDSLPIVAVAIIYFVRIAELSTRRDTVAGRVRENLTLRLFMAVGTLMAAGSVLEYWLEGGGLRRATFLPGVAFGLASFSLRRGAIAALGKVWSLHVEIREEHPLVEEGPFRLMRHPTYFSMILELLATGLLCHAWIMLAIIPLGFIPALWLRLRIEEAALVEKFGDRYRDYQRRIPMLFPYKWPAAK